MLCLVCETSWRTRAVVVEATPFLAAEPVSTVKSVSRGLTGPIRFIGTRFSNATLGCVNNRCFAGNRRRESLALGVLICISCWANKAGCNEHGWATQACAQTLRGLGRLLALWKHLWTRDSS